MNSGWLIESAGLWAFHGAMMTQTDAPLPIDAVHAYWLRNRTRFNAWNGLLTKLKDRLDSPLASRRAFAWHHAGTLIEEILLSEPLTRICAAVAMRLEERLVDEDSRAILHNVFTTHLEIRNRALRWILEGIDAGVSKAQHLNRIRAYLENWTDLLIGFFAVPDSSAEYAFCEERVRDFSEEYGHRSLGDVSETVWTLLLAGNRTWISTHCTSHVLFPAMGREIVQAALGMVHPAWFDSLGVLPSKAAHSLTHGLQFVDQTLESLNDGSWMMKSQITSSNDRRFTA